VLQVRIIYTYINTNSHLILSPYKSLGLYVLFFNLNGSNVFCKLICWQTFILKTPFKSFSRCKSKSTALIPAVAEPPELFRLKCANDRRTTAISLSTSNGTILWSVGSPPDTTTVQQDRSRFTSHEGEFTSQNSSSTFNLQPYIHYYKPSSKKSKFIQMVFKLTSITACPNLQRKEKFMRLHMSRRRTPSLALGLVSLRRVTAGRGRVPLHGPAKRNRRWPHKVVRGILARLSILILSKAYPGLGIL
jgi:hypothetical protein